MKPTDEQRTILAQMADGWTPFKIQLSGAEIALLRNGMVEETRDKKNRTVLMITEKGRRENVR
jgi:hypothetical protein